MTDESSVVPPAGWFTDPLDPDRQRWWDGSGWTDRVLPEEVSGFRSIADADPPRAAFGHIIDPLVVSARSAAPASAAAQPLTRRELRKRVGRLTYDRERWRPSVDGESTSDRSAAD